jgi:uncharacterized protein with HEPN domain
LGIPEIKNGNNMTKEDSNKDAIFYILGSIQLITNWIKGHNQESYVSSIKVRDATIYRLKEIRYWSSKIDDDFKIKYEKFPWFLFSSFLFIDHLEYDEIWQLIKKGIDGKGLYKLAVLLEEIAGHEFQGKKIKSKELTGELEWSRDYKYPITTKKSLWTVEKK